MMVTSITVQGDSGSAYTIKPNPTGGAYCTCAAWKFSHADTAHRMCKHIAYVTELLAQKV